MDITQPDLFHTPGHPASETYTSHAAPQLHEIATHLLLRSQPAILDSLTTMSPVYSRDPWVCMVYRVLFDDGQVLGEVTARIGIYGAEFEINVNLQGTRETRVANLVRVRREDYPIFDDWMEKMAQVADGIRHGAGEYLRLYDAAQQPRLQPATMTGRTPGTGVEQPPADPPRIDPDNVLAAVQRLPNVLFFDSSHVADFAREIGVDPSELRMGPDAYGMPAIYSDTGQPLAIWHRKPGIWSTSVQQPEPATPDALVSVEGCMAAIVKLPRFHDLMDQDLSAFEKACGLEADELRIVNDGITMEIWSRTTGQTVLVWHEDFGGWRGPACKDAVSTAKFLYGFATGDHAPTTGEQVASGEPDLAACQKAYEDLPPYPDMSTADLEEFEVRCGFAKGAAYFDQRQDGTYVIACAADRDGFLQWDDELGSWRAKSPLRGVDAFARMISRKVLVTRSLTRMG